MTARIAQSVMPRSRSDFRSSLRWTAPSIRQQKNRTPLFSRRSLPAAFTRQTGAITHSTITMSLGLIALFAVALLGFFYLQQVMGTASQGTDIHTLESKIVDLKEKQRQLELEGAQLRSLKTIETNVNQLNLVATEKVSYLENPADKVALSVTSSSAR